MGDHKTPKQWTLRRAYGFRICGVALVLAAFSLLPSPSWAAPQQPVNWTRRMATYVVEHWPQGSFTPDHRAPHWNYELGTLLDGMDAAWYATADGSYFRYIQHTVDEMVQPDGSIPTFHAADHELDSILMGRQLLLLYKVTQEKKYYLAALALRKQLSTQPRNASGGFWHKGNLPNQMWVDGLYMAEPFYADFARTFHQPQDFKDITLQFRLIEEHNLDPKTGLLFHGWDESKQQPWANKTTGDSPTLWSRGMGWYMMALVDTIPYYKPNDPGRAVLLDILRRNAQAIARYQDPESGLWWEVTDKPRAKGNYFESSAAGMFAYAFAKGVRLGYLPERYSENASRAYHGILTHFLKIGTDGSLTLTSTVKGVSLGGPDPHGAYSYYVTTPVISNDPKGLGAFLLASTEIETAPQAKLGRGDTVLMDAWFNHQMRQNVAGQRVLYHYKWTDYSNSGFSLLGHIFRSYGVKTETLATAPTAENLRGARMYVIASPDVPHWNPHPNPINTKEANAIADWVKDGGVLILMGNDPGNANLTLLSTISDRMGIHFDPVLLHHVIGEQIASGTILAKAGGSLFHHGYKLYMKDTCGLQLKAPAQPLLTDHEGTVMASAKYGKGTVFAVVDPWLYNEYTDGRKPELPASYQNFQAGNELVRWLIAQLPR